MTPPLDPQPQAVETEDIKTDKTVGRTPFAFGSLIPFVLAIGAILLTFVGASIAAHASPSVIFIALWQGAFGDAYALGETVTRTIPLLFTGLGVALAFRCGVWNIGAEGQFLAGALGVMAVLKVWTPSPPFLGLPVLLLAGAIAGAVWAMIPAILLLTRRVPEVISTLMLNFVAAQLFSWAIRGPLQEAARRYPQSDAVPDALQLWRFLPPTRVHAGLILALLAMAGVYYLLTYTVLGFQIRATGLNPLASRASGIPTGRAILWAMGLGGALAGLGGAVELLGVTFRLVEPFSPGYGFTAIAVALMGGLNPGWVGVSALFFGALDVGSGALQRVAGVPAVIVSIIQATVLFFIAWYHARRGTFRLT